MLYIFDIVPEPIMEEGADMTASSSQWLFGYIVIGLLIAVAVWAVIKLIRKSKKSKNKPE